MHKHVEPPQSSNILQALKMTFHEDVSGTSTSAILQAQSHLGRTSFLRGFTVASWENHLYSQSGNPADDRHRTEDVLVGLTRLFWQEQISFWEHHTKHVNEAAHQTTPFYDKLHAYKARIRFLHSQRDQCLHSHQEQYFHHDVEQFLEDATAHQLRQYLHHYEPVILQSIEMAKTQTQRRTIFSFPGFSRHSPDDDRPTHRFLVHLRNIANQFSPSNSQENRGDPPNRKHTRWKTRFPNAPSIRQFFTSAPD